MGEAAEEDAHRGDGAGSIAGEAPGSGGGRIGTAEGGERTWWRRAREHGLRRRMEEGEMKPACSLARRRVRRVGWGGVAGGGWGQGRGGAVGGCGAGGGQ